MPASPKRALTEGLWQRAPPFPQYLIPPSPPPRDIQARRTLIYVLDTCLRLLHPYMPFLTEELWQRLPHDGESIMISHWPLMAEDGALHRDKEAEAEFASIQVRVLRRGGGGL